MRSIVPGSTRWTDFAKTVDDAVLGGADEALARLMQSGVVTPALLGRMQQSKSLSASLTALVSAELGKLVEFAAGYTKPLPGPSELVLGPTKGTETIAAATRVFALGIDKAFLAPDIVSASGATPRQKVRVHRLVKDASLAKIFESLAIGHENLRPLCLTQGQIVQFVKKYSGWMSPDGSDTFFLFAHPCLKDEFFAAQTYANPEGNLYVVMRNMREPDIWRSERHRRVVVLSPTVA